MEQKVNNVNHPSHYNHGKIEVIEVIEDWSLDFCLGNAVKYIGRAKHKGRYIEDLEKAKWYIERAIKHEMELTEEGRLMHGTLDTV